MLYILLLKLLLLLLLLLLQGVTKCGCSNGLECRVTKEITILGQKIPFRQCMTPGLRFDVEQVKEEDMAAPEREKRFLVDVSQLYVIYI